jgi:outer membrane protein, multidrug efflux system
MPAAVNALPAEYGPDVARAQQEPAQTSPAPPDARSGAPWWQTLFADPALDALTAASLADPDLQAARARVLQAQARLRSSRALRWPRVDLQASASEQRTPVAGGFGEAGGLTGGAAGAVPGLGDGRVRIESYSSALVASYEVDAWGAAAAGERAARAALSEARAQLQAVRLGSLVTTIEAYLDLTYLRRAIALAQAQAEALDARVQATRQRYARGLVPSFEYYGVQARYREAATRVPALRAQQAQAVAALARVLGRYPGQIDALLAPPFRPQLQLAPPPAQLPVRLLIQRPDVLAAAARMEAARQQVGTARAALFPRVSLAAAIGTRGSGAGDVFDLDQWFTRLAADLLQPLFNAGGRRADLAGARAGYAQAASAFAQATLRAVGEVEAAYAAFDAQRERYRIALAQQRDAALTREQQAERFAAGLAELSDALDAEVDALAAELAQTEAARALAGAQLAIHRALGGAATGDDVDRLDDAGAPLTADALLQAVFSPPPAPVAGPK